MATKPKINTKVKNLKTPTRKGNEVSTSWSIPAAAKKDSAKDDVRVDGLEMLWVFDADPKNKGRKAKKGDEVEKDLTNKDSQKSDKEKIPRKDFYPNTTVKLNNAEFWIRCYNTENKRPNGKKKYFSSWQHKAIAFKVPDAPKSCSLSYNTSTGLVVPSYTSAHPDGKKEVYDTQVWVTCSDGSKPYDGTAYTDASKTLPGITRPGLNNLGIGAWRRFDMKCRNRGLKGNSTNVTAKTYVCHPNAPTLGTISLSGSGQSAMVRVGISNVGYALDGKTAIRPTTVTLQRLKNSSTENDAASAAAASGWEDVTSTGGNTDGLTDSWATAVSQAGKFTWYRAVAARAGYTTYGTPVQARVLNVVDSSTVAGAANIDSLTAGADGKSAKATLSGKQSDDVGYEVSWSSSSDAWESTEQPDTFETTGSSLVIKGLEEGTRYYVKARAFDLDSDGNRVYGDYSGVKDVTPQTTPSAVAMDCPDIVARGQAIQVTWTYDTDAQQEQWRLVDSAGNAMFSGRGSSCARTISPSEYGSASSLTLHVEMTTGGGWASSGPRTVTIADPPTCALTAPALLTAQPYGISVASDKGDQVRVVITSMGTTGTGLHGDREQFAGDTVYSGVFSPAWAGDPRAATVTLPTGLAFHEGADYTVEAVCIDTPTGLESEPDAAGFEVAWAHQAEQPTGSAEVDAEAMSVTVTVEAPASAAMGDTFDLYRVTMDGERPIARNQPFGTSITDRLAPYTHDGEGLRYMAVTRTADGDTCASDDIEYSLASGMLRLDWGNDHVELPCNLHLSDEFSKDSEVRKHVDGTSQAYWNEGVTRKASLDADLIRFEDREQQEMVRDMLQHAGSVFVRTPDGLAFAADVQPGTIQRDCNSSLVPVSLTAVEHDLTDEGRPAAADIVQPEWGGGALAALDGTVYDYAGKFPLYEWMFIGYNSSTLYAYSPDGKVYTGAGAEQAGWTWDGAVLKDANDSEVPVTPEAS